MADALTWATSTSVVGSLTTTTIGFLPNTSAISMRMQLSQVVTRGCFGYYENPADIVSSVSGGGTFKYRRWTDDDSARATFTPFGATTKQTSLSYNTGTFSFDSTTAIIRARDRRNITVESTSGGSVSPSRLLANASADLSDWFYPNPTHVVVNTELQAVTTAKAVSADALINPYPRVIHGTTTDGVARGFGVDTLRFWGLPTATPGTLWARMTTPCKQYVAPSGGITGNFHTLYGLPPQVVYCYGVVILDFFDPGSVTYTITLTQSNALGVVVDTSTVGSGALSRSTFVSGGNTYHAYVANAVTVGGGSLVSQAHSFAYSSSVNYSGSAVQSFAPTIWHKTPCWNDGWAISGDETSTDYIPGYVMEVT